MNPFMHVGANPEIVGWTRTRGDQMMGTHLGASPQAVQAAMHAVMGTPAFAALARGMGAHAGQRFIAPGGGGGMPWQTPHGLSYVGPSGGGAPAPGGGAPGGGSGGGCGPFIPSSGCTPYVPAPAQAAAPMVAQPYCGGPQVAQQNQALQAVMQTQCGPTQVGQWGGGGGGGGWQSLQQALATTGPAPAAPVYAGGPGAAYGSQVQVVERPLTDIREFPLGFGPTSFPAGTEASVISRPQVVFRGERLVVPSTVAPFFSIIDVKVGNRSQLVNSVALPAQMFIETAVGIRLSFDTAAVAQDVALIVANGTATATTFQAALIGTAAQ
jgi:hypothetical protein